MVFWRLPWMGANEKENIRESVIGCFPAAKITSFYILFVPRPSNDDSGNFEIEERRRIMVGAYFLLRCFP